MFLVSCKIVFIKIEAMLLCVLMWERARSLATTIQFSAFSYSFYHYKVQFLWCTFQMHFTMGMKHLQKVVVRMKLFLKVSNVAKKVNAPYRISSSMSLEKGKALMKAFIELQFNYCSLIWKLHSRTLNNKISRIHKRALRTVYSEYNSSFNKLLDKNGSFTIH